MSRTEWGPSICNSDPADIAGNQHSDGMLRDLPAGTLDPFDWGVIETIVWIATRDEQAVRGAAACLEGEARSRGDGGFLTPGLRLQGAGPRLRAESVLRTMLPLDVADHHVDCPMFLGDGPCTCAERNRIRYCRCPDRFESRSSTCGCVGMAERSFLEAFRGGLTVSGRRDGDAGYEDVDARKRVGAKFTFSPLQGFRVLPAYNDLKIPVKDIMQRWPRDFADMPLQGASSTRLGTEAAVATPISGKANTYVQVFCDRLRAGLTKRDKPAEVKAIRLKVKTASHDPKPDTVDKAIRSFWNMIEWDEAGKPANAVDVISAVVADSQK